MNIKVDLLELLKEEGEVIDAKHIDGLPDIIKFVKGKLSGLKKAMQQEENNKECFVMVHLMAPQEQWHQVLVKKQDEMRITVEGYSQDLTKLIYETFEP